MDEVNKKEGDKPEGALCISNHVLAVIAPNTKIKKLLKEKNYDTFFFTLFLEISLLFIF